MGRQGAALSQEQAETEGDWVQGTRDPSQGSWDRRNRSLDNREAEPRYVRRDVLAGLSRGSGVNGGRFDRLMNAFYLIDKI